MIRSLTITAAALGALLFIAQPSSAQRLGFRGPRAVIVGPAFGYGPGWYGYGWYDPYWGPVYSVPKPSGEVKLMTHFKDASVYVDGGYAGTAGKLKHFDLMPGNHNVELRDSTGKTLFQEQVQIIRDKTTEVHVD